MVVEALEEQVKKLSKEDLRVLLRKVTWACLIAGMSDDEVTENVEEKIQQHGVTARKASG